MRAHVALQFELAMGLTATLDADEILGGFARTLLRRLSLRGVAAFACEAEGLVRRCAVPHRYALTLTTDEVDALAARPEAAAFPPRDLGDGAHRQVFSLPRYGALVMDRHGAPLPAVTVGALLPLLTRCGHLLRASMDRTQAEAREREAQEQRFASVLGALREAVVAADEGGVIRLWNDGAARLFGASAAEMLGAPLERVMPAGQREAHRAGMARLAGTGEHRVLDRLIEVMALRADGSEVPVEMLISRLSLGGEARFVAVLRDISERRALEAERTAQRAAEERLYADLRDERDRLDALLSSSSAILYAARLPEARVDFVSSSAQEILGFAPEEMQSPGFWVDALHPDDRDRVLAVATSGESDRYVNEYRHRDAWGGYRWLRDHVRVLRDPAGRPSRVVGASFDITNRKRVERRIEVLLAMQRVVAELSSAFLRAPADTHEAAIAHALQGVGEHTAAQRAYVFRVDPATTSNTHEWCAPGVRPEIQNLQDLPQEAFAFFFSSLRDGGSLYIPAVSAMPDDLAGERDFLAAQGIERILVVPMSRDGAMTGFVGLDNPDFAPLEPDDVTALLRLFADELVVGLRSVEERRLRDELLHAVVEKHQALTALNEHLEARVRERTRQLAESDARFERLFEHAPQAMLLVDGAGAVLRANLRAGALLGCAPEALAGERARGLLPAEPATGERPGWMLRHDGVGFWAEVHREPMRFGDEVRVIVGVSDVSERVRRQREVENELREKEILLQEIHHRVKNNLQIVSSLLMLQRARVTDAPLREMLEESVSRVRSMALVHQQLYAVNGMTHIDLGGYARTLAQSIRATLTSSARIAVEADPDVTASMEQAVPLGLILNELLTNAIKHGIDPAHPAAAPWDVRVTVRRDGEALCVDVENQGRPLPPGLDWRTAPSLGLHLVRSLARQIRAELEVSATPCTRFALRLAPEAPA
jgi:PAS domain S-box-containing protein